MRLLRISPVLFILFLFSTSLIFGQSVGVTKVIKPVGYDRSKKLSDIKIAPPNFRDRTYKERVVPNKKDFLEEFQGESEWKGRDPLLQASQAGFRENATIDQNFDGVNNRNGYAPPDTDGDVGPNHFVQMVNCSFEIFNKSGNSLFGPANIITIWDGFSGPWSTTNDGDPIVVYDEYADRWLVSQFALPNYPSGPFYELIAVSTTGDPTGSWHRYAYEFDNMPDYPKFGVWPDGYYMAINQFVPPQLGFGGAGICAFDRDAMLVGDSNAEMQLFTLSSYGSLLPADADGATQPDAGTPAYFVNVGSTSLRLWEVDIDWANSNNSSVSLTNTFSVPGYSYGSISIDQPGTSQKLDDLAPRLMYRLQYRNFGTHEVMLTNHTVDAFGNGTAGVRWYELRNNGSGWGLHQQGTFAPDDGDHRWMGSVAMNGNGDLAVGYSVSGSSTYPSIRVAGQSAAESGSGLLNVTETSIFEGSASQTGVDRWGDYSAMVVDPTDDETFWYTTEYSTGGWAWRTRIASFNFDPPVVVAPVANFSGDPVDIMEGQSVQFTDLSQNNPNSWSWSFPGGTPSYSTIQNPVVTYSGIGTNDVSLTVGNSAGSDTENKTDYINVTEFLISYCESSGSNTNTEWIDRVDLGTEFNSSGNNGGYQDYTSNTWNLESGSTYDLTLTPGFSNRSRREFWRVWIDYNYDGDFNDAGEEVFAADGKKNTVNGTISIPSNLNVESTRMRVSMKYNAIPGSCEQFTYGEVEDYTVSIGEAVPLAPVANFVGEPTSVSEGGTVNFTDLSLNDPTSWTWTFAGGTPGSSSVQNPAVTYATAGTYNVSLMVSNDQGNDTKIISGYITITEGGTYCTSSASNNDLEWIEGVDIEGIPYSNAEPNVYSDFTSTIVPLTSGSSHSLTLTPGYSNKEEREFWRIWIDLNADGDFEDAGEQVFTANNKKGTVNGTLNVPAGHTGETRMRISMKHGSSPLPCEIFGGGEVEDYTVNLIASSNLVRSGELDLIIWPNPTDNVLKVEVSGDMQDFNWKLYDAFGRILQDVDESQRNFQVDVSGLSEGMYYIGAENNKDTVLKRFTKN